MTPLLGAAAGGGSGPPSTDDDADLLAEVRSTLRESHPLSLLMLTSGLLTATDPRGANPPPTAGGEPEAGADRDQLIASLLEVRRPDTSALLTALAA